MASVRGKAFVLLLLCAGSRCLKCPPPEELNPCSCSTVDGKSKVTCNSLNSTKDLVKVLESFKRKIITSFALLNSTFKDLPPGIFHRSNIVNLAVNNTDLDSLRNGKEPIFSGLEDTLKQLVIYNCFHRYASYRLPLNHLSSLSVLILQKNTISSIGNDWFDRGPYALEELIISDTQQETRLGNRAFVSLHNIMELKLENMKLKGIERSMLPSPAKRLKIFGLRECLRESLRRLSIEKYFLNSEGRLAEKYPSGSTYLLLGNFHHNLLRTLPNDMFTGMPKLEDIYLDHNAIYTLPETLWKPVWSQLDVIIATANPLVCDSRIKWIYRYKLQDRTFHAACLLPIRLRHRLLDKLTASDLE